MRLVEGLIDSVRGRDCPVKRVCIGLHWTVVESRFTGMSHTLKSGNKVEIASAGALVGLNAFELAERLQSEEWLEASLGLAALNSLIEPSGAPRNAFDDVVARAEGRTVTVVGRFPSNDLIRQRAAKAYFLEMDPGPGELPPEAAEDVLPESDVALITATALINHTLPRLLELAKNAEAIVLGPSTPMNDVLFAYGADTVAGIRVADADALFASIAQGVKKFRNLAGTEAIVRTAAG